MLGIIITIIIVGLVIYYLTNLPFELGTGFTEMKKKAREGERRDSEKKKSAEEPKLLE